MRIVNMTQYNAGIQLYGTRKPLIPPVQAVQSTPQHKKSRQMKERLKKLLAKKDFLDKRTVDFLERNGFINTYI